MSWSDFVSGDTDAGQFVTTTLATKYKDNIQHLFDSQLRMGLLATPKRYALATGNFNFTFSVGSSEYADWHTEAITFSTDADDGDPNFSAAPVWIGCMLQQDTTSGQPWHDKTSLTDNYHVTWSLDHATRTATGMTVRVKAGRLATGTVDSIQGDCFWAAIGLVTSGE